MFDKGQKQSSTLSCDSSYYILIHIARKIKIKLISFKSSECINEKRDGPYRGFGYLSLFSDPIDFATWCQRELL